MDTTFGPAGCREVREGLTEYLENALPPARRQGCDEHLARCAECRRFLDELRATLRLLAATPGEAMPAEMKETLLRAYRGRPPA